MIPHIHMYYQWQECLIGKVGANTMSKNPARHQTSPPAHSTAWSFLRKLYNQRQLRLVGWPGQNGRNDVGHVPDNFLVGERKFEFVNQEGKDDFWVVLFVNNIVCFEGNILTHFELREFEATTSNQVDMTRSRFSQRLTCRLDHHQETSFWGEVNSLASLLTTYVPP